MQDHELKPERSQGEEAFLIGSDAMRRPSKHPVYLPTEAEIANHCRRFQASWSDVERDKRRRGWQPE